MSSPTTDDQDDFSFELELEEDDYSSMWQTTSFTRSVNDIDIGDVESTDINPISVQRTLFSIEEDPNDEEQDNEDDDLSPTEAVSNKREKDPGTKEEDQDSNPEDEDLKHTDEEPEKQNEDLGTQKEEDVNKEEKDQSETHGAGDKVAITWWFALCFPAVVSGNKDGTSLSEDQVEELQHKRSVYLLLGIILTIIGIVLAITDGILGIDTGSGAEDEGVLTEPGFFCFLAVALACLITGLFLIALCVAQYLEMKQDGKLRELDGSADYGSFRLR